METLLKKLFDYQKFENNEKLAEMLDSAETSALRKLSDEELYMVSAGKGCPPKPSKYMLFPNKGE